MDSMKLFLDSRVVASTSALLGPTRDNIDLRENIDLSIGNMRENLDHCLNQQASLQITVNEIKTKKV